MSRIGKMPVAVPAGVTVAVEGKSVSVKGSKGELTFDLKGGIEVVVEESQVVVSRADDTKASKSMHGTTRSIISNMIEGVANGYQKELEIQGVGYKALLKGKSIILSLGFSHEIDYVIPEGILVECPTQTDVKISGIDKQLVGQVAARIRSFSPAEPYKGKGVRYKGEQVRRKEGKAVA
ncbi:50S ribosomal protein L6 [Verrucomicrobiota bacterium]